MAQTVPTLHPVVTSVPSVDLQRTGRLPYVVAKAPVTAVAALAQLDALRRGADEKMNHFLDECAALVRETGDPTTVAEWITSATEYGAPSGDRLPGEQAPPLITATVTAPAALGLPDAELLHVELEKDDDMVSVGVQGEGGFLTPGQADAVAEDVIRWALTLKGAASKARHPQLSTPVADEAFNAALDAIGRAVALAEDADGTWAGLRAAVNLYAGRDARA
ncbi:hypothetical protein [Streptomyces sp. NPDC090026]|uniref:hypothetical protein n=1 Tax=Streptomyces sp. NPDC090026 TaxID=3365923 RepID=UPI00381ECB6F